MNKEEINRKYESLSIIEKLAISKLEKEIESIREKIAIHSRKITQINNDRLKELGELKDMEISEEFGIKIEKGMIFSIKESDIPSEFRYKSGSKKSKFGNIVLENLPDKDGGFTIEITGESNLKYNITFIQI